MCSENRPFYLLPTCLCGKPFHPPDCFIALSSSLLPVRSYRKGNLMITRNKLITAFATVAVFAGAHTASLSARPVGEVAPDDTSTECGLFQDWWENDLLFPSKKYHRHWSGDGTDQPGNWVFEKNVTATGSHHPLRIPSWTINAPDLHDACEVPFL